MTDKTKKKIEAILKNKALIKALLKLHQKVIHKPKRPLPDYGPEEFI